MATESRKVKRFIYGLRFNVQQFMMSHVGMTLKEAIEIAKQLEFLVEEEGRKWHNMSTQRGGSQSSGLPPKDAGNRGSGVDTYRGGRSRSQCGSSSTGPGGNAGRKRDHNAYS